MKIRNLVPTLALLVALGVPASLAQESGENPGEDKPDALPAVPAGEKTGRGLRFAFSGSHGEGEMLLSRQNDCLRIDVRIPEPYDAGDGERNRGSALEIILSADGQAGRRMIFYPAALWYPSPNLPAWRMEASYAKGESPKRIADKVSFAAESRVAFWAHWEATLWIDLARVIVPGNTPSSRADNWRLGLIAGEGKGLVFPQGLDTRDPGATPERSVTFKVSELPELAKTEKSPYKTAEEAEKTLFDSMNEMMARLQAQEIAKADGILKSLTETRPDQLFPFHLRWLIAMQLSGKIEGIDGDAGELLKLYLDACPGQLDVHLEYLAELLRKDRAEDAETHFKTLVESPLAKASPETAFLARTGWARLLLAFGRIDDGDKLLAEIADDPAATATPEARDRLRSVQWSLLSALLEWNRTEEAGKRYESFVASGLHIQDGATAEVVAHEWVKLLIDFGGAATAEPALDSLLQSEAAKSDPQFRLRLRITMAGLAERKGDSAAAAAIYGAILEEEEANLSPQQTTGLIQYRDMQQKAAAEFEQELKYREEDAKKTNPRLTIETNKGTFVVELFEDDAPNTVASLVKLAKDGFYDGLTFHRFVEGFVIQGGDPAGDGSGGPGYRLKSEVSRRNHFRGTFAMACSRPKGDTEGSQFYACLSNDPSVVNLSGNYVVTGRVIEGMDVVDRLRQRDVMKSVTAGNLRDHEYEPKTIPE